MPEQDRRHFWEVPERLVTGAWAEKRRLASQLRELVALCVTTDAPELELSSARTMVEAASALLRAHPRRTFQEGFGSCQSLDELAVFTDRATLVGACNPYSPPMRLAFDGETATALVIFGPPFEGAPGFVHGGIVAAAFDQLFGYLQVRLETPALTRVLTVNYLRPTPLQTELRLEGRLVRSEGRRQYVTARLFVGEDAIAEAEGVFVTLETAGFHRLFAEVSKKPA